MKRIQLKDLKQAARRLVNSTPDNSVQESGLYRCERHNGHTYIARLDDRFRTMDWIEIFDD
jgi:hypothetical protein